MVELVHTGRTPGKLVRQRTQTVNAIRGHLAELGISSNFGRRSPSAPSRFLSRWFGIIVVVVTEISLITPPVGLNVFVLRGVVPDVSTGTVFRGVTPFWIADIFRLALLVMLPWLALALPNSM